MQYNTIQLRYTSKYRYDMSAERYSYSLVGEENKTFVILTRRTRASTYSIPSAVTVLVQYCPVLLVSTVLVVGLHPHVD